jgi:hypothetical protein
VSFDPASLIISFVISSIGFVLLTYGRKMSRPPQMLTGIILLIFPYFVPGVAWMLGIAGALLLLLWVSLQRGY